MTSFSNSGEYHSLICRSVQTAPGDSVLTRMLKGPNSRARTRVSPVMEALLALYTGRPVCLRDRKSTRLNSSHGYISYAVFCLKKKKKEEKVRHSIIS